MIDAASANHTVRWADTPGGNHPRLRSVVPRSYHGLDRCMPLTTTVADTTLNGCRSMPAQLSFLCSELNIRSIAYQSFIHYGRRME